jgi:HlyD family secretion protein
MNQTDSHSDIETLLGTGDDSRVSRLWLRRSLWVAAAVIVIFTTFLLLHGSRGSKDVAYITNTVSRGDMTITVTATGKTEPRNEVSVGIEVSGTIAAVFVDHNDTVEKGDLLARLDTTILSAQLAQSNASLQVARASKQEAEATLMQMESDYMRLVKLREASGGILPSAQELETAKASRDRAKASVESAKAQVEQAKAQLTVNRTELAKAEVVSPVRGMVLSRLVDPGQTVAATLQTPELFVIAEDLKEMQLSIEIDEADVGQVREGQSAEFTVDAYPDEEFPAEITQLRYAPISSAGVVTYEAILSVDNSDMRLRPGMTATAVITAQQIEDALLVPNAALRFSPRFDESGGTDGGSFVSALVPRPPRGSAAPVKVDNSGRYRRLWLLDERGELSPVNVIIGSSDGVSTEILAGDLAEGAQVIIEQRDPS